MLENKRTTHVNDIKPFSILKDSINSTRYSLSENWQERHHIFTADEEDNLEKALSAATIRIHLHDTQRNIDLLLEKLESGDCSGDEENRLLREKISLDKKVMELSSVLGVVILPK